MLSGKRAQCLCVYLPQRGLVEVSVCRYMYNVHVYMYMYKFYVVHRDSYNMYTVYTYMYIYIVNMCKHVQCTTCTCTCTCICMYMYVWTTVYVCLAVFLLSCGQFRVGVVLPCSKLERGAG